MSKWTKGLILSELKKVTEIAGKFPTHRMLDEMGRSDLRNAIILSGKKISEYASETGQSTRRKRNFWNKVTIRQELQKVCDQLGYFPTRKELIQLGYSSLHLAMWKSETSIQFWQQLLGYETKRKENGYWATEDNIVKEFMAFTESYDFLPTQQALRNNGKHDLARAIDRSGKGLAYFQKLAGFEPPFYEATDGHFLDSSYELTLDEWLYAHGIEHEVHGYIDRAYGKYRYDFKIRDAYVEIWGYSEKNKTDLAVEYREKRKLKEELYKQLNLHLISLESSFFSGSTDAVENRIAETFANFVYTSL